MSVDLRGLQTGVSQQFLDDSQVSPPVEEVGGEAVAKGVRVGGNRRTAVDHTPDVSGAQACPAAVEEDGVRAVTPRSRAARDPRDSHSSTASAHRSCIGTRRWRRPFPITVTVRAPQVHVADVEAAQLRHAQPAPVEQLEHGVVPGRRGPRAVPGAADCVGRGDRPGGVGLGVEVEAVEHVLELAAVEHPGQARSALRGMPGDGRGRASSAPRRRCQAK